MDTESFFSTHGEVDELEITDELCAHLLERGTYDKHDVSVTEVLEAHARAPKYFINVGAAHDPTRAPLVMLGLTGDGRLLCVPIVPTGRLGVWRPITAFEANHHHRMKYQGGTT